MTHAHPALIIAATVMVIIHWLAVCAVVLAPLVIKLATAAIHFVTRQMGRKVYDQNIDLDKYFIFS